MSQKTRQFPIILLISFGFAAVVLGRMPAIILEGGRFWAEEGHIYFANAWNLRWYDALFSVHSGYINITASAGTWVALLLGGVANAPLITVFFALFIQWLPVYVILTHEFPWNRSLFATMTAVLMCALPPVMGEVWLNTITSQFHLALFAALVFSAPPLSKKLFLFDSVFLALSALSGPATSFLAPLFLFIAFKDRNAKTTTFALITGVGFCVQLMVYFFNFMPQRGGRLGPAELMSVIGLHTIVLQFAGLNFAQNFANYLYAIYTQSQSMIVGPIIFLMFYGLALLVILRLQNKVLVRLFIANLTISIFSFYEALEGSLSGFMNMKGGQRYAFVPDVLNALLVVSIYSVSRGLIRNIFFCGSLVLLFNGVINYRAGLGGFSNGPEWRSEVAAWRRDPSEKLLAWPGGQWFVNLKSTGLVNSRDDIGATPNTGPAASD